MKNRIDLHRKLTLLAGVLAFVPMFAGVQVNAQTLRDSGSGAAITALVSYAQTLEPQATASRDEAHDSLRAFVEQIDSGRAQSAGADDRVGAALAQDDAFGALREYAESIPGGAKVVLAKGEKVPVKAEPGEAVLVGSQVCLGCHAVQAAAFNLTLMGRVFRNPRNAQERGGCETCHGPGSLHVKAGGGRGVGGIISFRKDDVSRSIDDNNAICLSCHEKGHQTYWKGSTHETRAVACTDCHQVMQKVSPRFQLAKGTEVETCFQCHREKRAKFLRSAHMPLPEGKMTCSDCHQPHGGPNDSLLRAASINDTCYRCHAEKRGPFLWEHPPVRENRCR